MSEDTKGFTKSQNLGIASAGLSLASSFSSYYASKAQARIVQAEGRVKNAVAQANADALRLTSEFNAKITRNNAMAASNQKLYESSALRANRKLILQKSQGDLVNYRRQIRSGIAAAQVSNPRLSTDVIKSMELEAFSKISTENIDTAAALQSIDEQLTENERVAKLTMQYGNLKADQILSAGRNDSFYTSLSGRNAQNSANMRASMIKLQASSDLLGGVASTATGLGTYF